MVDEVSDAEMLLLAALLTLEEDAPGSLARLAKPPFLSADTRDYLHRMAIPLAAQEAQGLLPPPKKMRRPNLKLVDKNK